MVIASYGGRPSLWFRLSSSGRYVIAPNSALAPASYPFLGRAGCYSPVIGKLRYWIIPPALLSSIELTQSLYQPLPFALRSREKRARHVLRHQIIAVKHDRAEVPHFGQARLVIKELEVGPVKFLRQEHIFHVHGSEGLCPRSLVAGPN